MVWRAVAGARIRSSPLIAARSSSATKTELSAVLAMARRHGADRDAEAPHRKRVWLDAAHQTSPNQRTLYKFPDAERGAELLRLAAVSYAEAGIVPIMLIHDGILLEEASRERIELAKEIIVARARHLRRPRDRRRRRPDAENGTRYHDKRRCAADLADGDARLDVVGAVPVA